MEFFAPQCFLLWGSASRWPNEQVNAQVFGPEAVLPVEALSLLSVEEEFYLSEKELEKRRQSSSGYFFFFFFNSHQV